MDKDQIRKAILGVIERHRRYGHDSSFADLLITEFIIIPRNELPECAIDEGGRAHVNPFWIPSSPQGKGEYGLALLNLARSEAYAAHEAAKAERESTEAERLAAELAADWAVAEQLWDAREESLKQPSGSFDLLYLQIREAYLAMARTARNIYNPTTKED